MLDRPEITVLSEERVEGIRRYRVIVDVAPGRTTRGYLLLPAGPGPFPAVLDVYYHPEDGSGRNEEKRGQNDFGWQLARRGFAALCIGQTPTGSGAELYWPNREKAALQPLSYLAFVAAHCWRALAARADIDAARIGVIGHSYGGKWSLFAGALWEKFAAVCISDPGIVFDETRGNINYWEPWYLGWEEGFTRPRGIPNAERPRTGAYKKLVAEGRDLHELQTLICPRPFFVAGGAEDPPHRWKALNHAVAVNRILGVKGRVGMANRPKHKITAEANAQMADFFVRFLMR